MVLGGGVVPPYFEFWIVTCHAVSSVDQYAAGRVAEHNSCAANFVERRDGDRGGGRGVRVGHGERGRVGHRDARDGHGTGRGAGGEVFDQFERGHAGGDRGAGGRDDEDAVGRRGGGVRSAERVGGHGDGGVRVENSTCT